MLKRIMVAIVLIALIGGVAGYRWLFGDLPALDATQLATPSVRIVDRHAELLYDVLDAEGGRHTVVGLEQIPLVAQQAVIATEDRNFYANAGVDVEGIVRALWLNVRGQEVVAGGSTITQQVARTLLLDETERTERTVRRKLRESWLAWQMTRQLEKDEILALYLNQIYFGAQAYGIEAAANTFLGKSSADLTTAESALLIGLIQSPAVYNPFTNLEVASERQHIVLHLMHDEGYLDDAQLALALREPIQLATTPYPINAPHFVMMVRNEIDQLLATGAIVNDGGLTVRTTLDWAWQQEAERMVGEQIGRLNDPTIDGWSHNAHNAAIIAAHPETGEILALVGNPDYFDATHAGAINMAIAPRQPGSTLKPFVYASALGLDDAWTSATMVADVRTGFITHEGDPYVPVNYGRVEHGPVLVRDALASSLNIPAVKALDSVGVNAMLADFADYGIPTGDPDDYDLALALGGVEVRLLDLVLAYGTLANGGSQVKSNLILDITDANGEIVYTPDRAPQPRILDERIAWLVSDMLSDDQARERGFGRNSVLNIGRIAAVKTGTSNDFRDNWTVGYTLNLVVGVWVGNANLEPMVDVTGITGAAPLWHTFMRTVLANEIDQPFDQPEGLIQVEVCSLSGLLPSDSCPYRRREWFLAGTQPTENDTFFRTVSLDSRTNQLAGEDTSSDQRIERFALDLPPELHPWAREAGWLLWDELLAVNIAQVEAEQQPLRLVTPVSGTTFRISPTLPRDAQKIRWEAVADSDLHTVSIWHNDTLLGTFDQPPYQIFWQLQEGNHEIWAEAMDGTGEIVQSERVVFTVKGVDEE